jgi:sugar lactone lactonase YvrE
MTMRSAAAASLCIAFLAGAAAAQTGEPELELLAQLPNGPGNLTVAPDGTVVISVHPSFASEIIAYAVSPQGQVRPFPDAAANAAMGRVLSVRADDDGNVWMLSGQGGTRNLYVVDIETGALRRTIGIDAPGFLNDMALALDHGAIVMSVPGSPNALGVLDVETGALRRVLEDHESVNAEDIDAPIDGVPLAQGRTPDGELIPLRSGVNPITIDAAHEWVYYGAMSGATVWRVRLSDLLDESLSAEDLAARVERYGAKSPSAGISMDDAGNVYVTDVGARGVGVTTPDGQYRLYVQDDALFDWPDGLTVGPDGHVYSAANGLYRGWASHAHLDRAQPPFPLVRFRALADTTAGR